MSTISILISKCPVSSVTVFADRAEVTRAIPLFASDDNNRTANQEESTASAPEEIVAPRTIPRGEGKIIIAGITPSANMDSVRINGTGPIKILEVSNDTKVQRGEVNMTALQKIEATIEKIKADIKLVEQQKDRVQKQRDLVKQYAQTLSGTSGQNNPPIPISQMQELLTFYGQCQEDFDSKDNEANDKLTALRKDLSDANFEADKLRGVQNQSEMRRETTLVVEFLEDIVESSSQVQLFLTYMVSNSQWEPSYDIRVDSEKKQLQLHYFGEISQNTGEDWTECKLTLSTATPSISGTPPSLPRKYVDFKETLMQVQASKFYKASASKRSSISAGASYAAPPPPQMLMQNSMLLDEIAPSSAPIVLGGTTVKAGGDSVCSAFTIEHSCSVPSDNIPHKSTIAVIELRPIFVHYASPAITSHVYLQCKTRNSSAFVILESRKTSVFLDGNFVSTTHMKNAAPGESFTTFLGVDKSVKVQYMPPKSVQESKGWMGKAEKTKYEYCTILQNTKSYPVRVIVADMLPLSRDDLIKVELINPTAESLKSTSSTGDSDMLSSVVESNGEGSESGNSDELPDDFVTQNKFTNNLVWLKTVPSGKKTEIKFVYRVTWPEGSNVQIHQSETI